MLTSTTKENISHKQLNLFDLVYDGAFTTLKTYQHCYLYNILKASSNRSYLH